MSRNHNLFPGDPDFSDAVSNITLQMVDKAELAQLRSEVDQPTAHSWSVPSVPEPVGSHVAVMDSNDVYISVVRLVRHLIIGSVFSLSQCIICNIFT